MCYNLLFLYVQQEKENGSEREMNTFVHLQEEILQYFLRFPQYILFRWNVNCYGVLVKCDAEEMEDYTQRAIAQIQMNCESQNANADWYVVVGTPVERLSMLKECYDRVNHYGAYRFLYPQMHVLSEETLKSYLPAQDDTRIAEVDATKMSLEIISEFLAKGSSKEVYNFVESYLQSISEVIHSVIFRDYVVLNIRFTAIAFMERNGVTKEEFLAHIGKYGTNVHVQQDEVFEYFLSILQTAIDLRDEQNTNLSSKTLKKALAYIDEHYTSENLSLGTVACEVQVGANYLSSVFSQNMQKTFTEYISEKRMEKAKMQSFFIGITMRILSIVIFVIVYGRMIEIYCMVSLAPIPMATWGNHEQSHMGQNYLKSLFALGFQGFLILICVAIYAVLLQNVAISGDAINSIWSIVGYTVLLCFTLFKTGSVARSILGAH